LSKKKTAVDYRRLMIKVEKVAQAIERDDPKTIIHRLAEEILANFRHELGVQGVRLYGREGDGFILLERFPGGVVEDGPRIPRTYPPVALVLERGHIYMLPGDPRLDPQLEQRLGAAGFAAVELGRRSYLLGFDIEPGRDRRDVLYTLGVIRHIANQTLRQEQLDDSVREIRRLQDALLPRTQPAFGAFDISGHCEAMESVGGDIFDYIPISDKILGLMVADVTGHGLPAAMQVRDIYTGLRMGLGRDFKMVRTIERLNAIIAGSTLSSRFVSLFYGELELNHNFIYVNAGHPAPLYLKATGEVKLLEQGGPVLGPVRDARYERGFVRLGEGDQVVLYTDGITEAAAAASSPLAGEEFGASRLADRIADFRQLPAQEIVQRVFAELEQWTAGEPSSDDRTLVVIRRPSE